MTGLRQSGPLPGDSPPAIYSCLACCHPSPNALRQVPEAAVQPHILLDQGGATRTTCVHYWLSSGKSLGSLRPGSDRRKAAILAMSSSARDVGAKLGISFGAARKNDCRATAGQLRPASGGARYMKAPPSPTRP